MAEFVFEPRPLVFKLHSLSLCQVHVTWHHHGLLRSCARVAFHEVAWSLILCVILNKILSSLDIRLLIYKMGTIISPNA